MSDMFSFRIGGAVVALALFAGIANAAPPPLPKGMDNRCIESKLENCEVTGFGAISLYGSVSIAFQIQNGYSNENGIAAGVVLFEARDREWFLLASDFTGAHYDVPLLAEGDGWILHVPGYTMGTGAFNADLLFVRDLEGFDWQQIDIDSWHDDIGPMLPEGLEIWKGVDFDFGDWFWSDFIARTPLWQQSDANCCATGGWAEIAFDIEDGRLVPTRVHYRPFEDDE